VKEQFRLVESRRRELAQRERVDAQRLQAAEEKRLKRITDHEGAMSYFTDLVKVRACARGSRAFNCAGVNTILRASFLRSSVAPARVPAVPVLPTPYRLPVRTAGRCFPPPAPCPQDKIAPLESSAKEEELKRYQALKVQRLASKRLESMQADVPELLREDAEVAAVREQVRSRVAVPIVCCVVSAVCCVQCAVCCVLRVACSVQCAVCCVRCAVCCVLCAVCSVLRAS
jgi:hypothetical protein